MNEGAWPDWKKIGSNSDLLETGTIVFVSLRVVRPSGFYLSSRSVADSVGSMRFHISAMVTCQVSFAVEYSSLLVEVCGYPLSNTENSTIRKPFSWGAQPSTFFRCSTTVKLKVHFLKLVKTSTRWM